MNIMRTKVTWFLTLALAVFALAATSAFADGTPPGPRHHFNCDAANARLTAVNARIAKIQARIASGHVKDPTIAAARLKLAQDRAALIQAVIAKRCPASA